MTIAFKGNMAVPPQTFTGSIGLTGVQGQTGVWGMTGLWGDTGLPGIQGATGIRGTTGIQGATGLPGPTGMWGVTGLWGLTGVQGPQGATGLKAAILFLGQKHRALSCVESPETRFEDLIETEIIQPSQYIAVDPLFIEACEPDSIRVRSVHSDIMGLGYSRLSIEMKNGVPRIFFSADKCLAEVLQKMSLPICIALTGLRRGYRVRFPLMTQEQADNNMKFWDAATKL